MNVIRNGKQATLICEFDSDIDPAVIDDMVRLYDFDFVKFIDHGKDD